MVKVSIATPDHQEIIATMLSNYYSRLNEVYGFEKYKTDKDIMLKHVSRRISTSDSEFKYFVALDNNDNIIGFINILESRIPEVTVINVIESDDEKVIINSLLSYTVEYLRSKGYTQFISEISQIDSHVGNVLNSMDSKLLESTYVTYV